MIHIPNRVFRAMAAAALACLTATACFAQEVKGPIKIIVGYGPGNSADSIARLLAQKMTASLGVPVFVENKVGASSRIAIAALKNSAPDGKTLMVGTFSVMGVLPMIFTKTTYHLSDFEPVAHVANSNVVIAAPVDAPYKTLAEYAAWLKQHPDKAQIANEAPGSPAHLLGIEFGRMNGVNMTLVPYKSTSQMITDLIGKQVPAAAMALPSVYPLHQSGQVRILAVGSEQRSPSAPDLPTVKESGFDLSATSTYGAWMPLHTPRPIVDKISEAIVAAVAEPDVQEKLKLLGLEPTGKGRAEFVQISNEAEKSWAKIVKDTGFKIDE
jgi:tripartite-type tricarboxylate transporter receptor subunit TctC